MTPVCIMINLLVTIGWTSVTCPTSLKTRGLPCLPPPPLLTSNSIASDSNKYLALKTTDIDSAVLEGI